jgi:serine-type D-Ala-D-Ala carboxypeptidase (penicillin-binding protein 5/6)|tara:strand:- start:228 stop:488 length:261 start_codon:yes stop_codon:yes gene_type:complete
MDKPAPHCSASSWAVFDQKTNSLLFGKMEKERREVASLTKIMTAFVVLKLLDRFSIEDTTLIKVGSDASSVIGTSAELVEGDTLSI